MSAVLDTVADFPDTDGLPASLSAVLDSLHGRMSREGQADFSARWTRAVEAAGGVDLEPVLGLYLEWRASNWAAVPSACAATLVSLVGSVAR